MAKRGVVRGGDVGRGQGGSHPSEALRPSHRRARSRWLRERRTTRSVLLLGVAAIVLILAIPGYGYYSTFVAPPRQSVVKVDEKSYSLGHLLKILRMFQRGSQASGQAANLGSLPFQLVNTLAENEIIRQAAPRLNLTIAKEELDAEVHRRFLGEEAAKNPLTADLAREFQERYRQYLNLVGLTEQEHREIVTNELYRDKMRELQGQRVQRVQPQARVFAIEIPAVDNALQLSDEVRTEFARGVPFAELVAWTKLAQPPDVVRRGGELGWVPRGIFADLDKLIFEELPVGKLSDPLPQVDSQGGGTRYLILLVKERAEAREVETQYVETLKTRALQEWLNEERQHHEVKIAFDSNRYEWLMKQLRLSGERRTSRHVG